MTAKGKINHTCIAPSAGQNVAVHLTIENIGDEAGSFALIFCASSAASAGCDLVQWGSSAFLLGAGESRIFDLGFTAPDMAYSYILELQRWQD